MTLNKSGTISTKKYCVKNKTHTKKYGHKKISEIITKKTPESKAAKS